MAERGRPSFRRLHSWNLDEPWSDLAAPSRLWDQFFGMGLADDDFFYAIPRSSLRARPALPMPVTPDEEDRFKSLFLRPRRSESSAPGHGMSEVGEINFLLHSERDQCFLERTQTRSRIRPQAPFGHEKTGSPHLFVCLFCFLSWPSLE